MHVFNVSRYIHIYNIFNIYIYIRSPPLQDLPKYYIAMLESHQLFTKYVFDVFVFHRRISRFLILLVAGFSIVVFFVDLYFQILQIKGLVGGKEFFHKISPRGLQSPDASFQKQEKPMRNLQNSYSLSRFPTVAGVAWHFSWTKRELVKLRNTTPKGIWVRLYRWCQEY